MTDNGGVAAAAGSAAQTVLAASDTKVVATKLVNIVSSGGVNKDVHAVVGTFDNDSLHRLLVELHKHLLTVKSVKSTTVTQATRVAVCSLLQSRGAATDEQKALLVNLSDIACSMEGETSTGRTSSSDQEQS
mgnify:FL=1